MKIYTEEDSIKDTGTEYYVSIMKVKCKLQKKCQ